MKQKFEFDQFDIAFTQHLFENMRGHAPNLECVLLNGVSPPMHGDFKIGDFPVNLKAKILLSEKSSFGDFIAIDLRNSYASELHMLLSSYGMLNIFLLKKNMSILDVKNIVGPNSTLKKSLVKEQLEQISHLTYFIDTDHTYYMIMSEKTQ